MPRRKRARSAGLLRGIGRYVPALLLLALAACRSADPGLGIAPDEPAATIAAIPATAGPIQFLPVVGVPADKAPLLSQALAKSAAASGLAISGADAATAPRRLKGYLSAIGEAEDTLVIYVWDVIGPAGDRISRIQGQVRVPGTGVDPWSSVGAPAFSDVADRTVAALRVPAAETSGGG